MPPICHAAIRQAPTHFARRRRFCHESAICLKARLSILAHIFRSAPYAVLYVRHADDIDATPRAALPPASRLDFSLICSYFCPLRWC
jgi:hypothetical protein